MLTGFLKAFFILQNTETTKLGRLAETTKNIMQMLEEKDTTTMGFSNKT